MDQPLRLSIRLPHTHCSSSPGGIRQVARLAEDLGFYAVSAQDHLLVDPDQHPCGGGPGDNRDVYECFQTLALAASVTQRVRLLTSVVVITFRHPVVLAKEAATLDVISDGRLMLGVGVGALRGRQSDMGFKLSSHRSVAMQEFEALGVKGDRGRIADEQLQVLDLLWRQESASFEGRTASFQELALYPKPLQRPRPPIVIGGRSEAAQRRAALFADGWIPSHEKPGHFAEGRERVLELAAEAGLEHAAIFGTNIDISIDRDDARAREVMHHHFAKGWETPEDMWEGSLAGSPERVVEQIARWREAGASLIDLKIVPRSPLEATLEQLQLLGEEVIPELAGM